MRREFFSGLALGAVLGSIALIRILLWPHHAQIYGEHYILVATLVDVTGLVIYFSVAHVILHGTLL